MLRLTADRDYSTASGSFHEDPFAGFGGSLGYSRESGLDLYRCGLRFYDVANARWLTRDPIGYDGGQNLYGYVSGNPVMGADPSGLTDYDAKWVHREIMKWQLQGFWDAKTNHSGGGIYDYKVNYPYDRFMVHGIWLNASQFGQYAAGSAGYYNGKGFGLWGVQAGGHIWEAMEDNNRGDGEVAFWGDDGNIDKWLIMLGANDAFVDMKHDGLDSTPWFGWQTCPKVNKRQALDYLKAYNLRMFGSIHSRPNSGGQVRNGRLRQRDRRL